MQDNAATADPIFYVRDKKRIWVRCCDEHTVGHEWSNEDGETASDEKTLELDKFAGDSRIVAFKNEEGNTKIWTKGFYREEPVIVQPFFTRAGAARYIAENNHNLNKPEIWVGSAYRNPEWQEARKMFLEAANV